LNTQVNCDSMPAMRISRFALLGVILAAFVPQTLKAQYSYWSGLGDGWYGQTPPANNGTANLYFSDSIFPFVGLSSSLNDFNSIKLANGNNYTFTGTTTLTLTSATGAIVSPDYQYGSLYFGSGINLGLVGPTLYNAEENFIYVAGQITGSGPLTLYGGPANTMYSGGAFIFNNSAGNAYTGATTVGDGTNLVSVGFWNTSGSPFGTGAVTLNDAELIAHNSSLSVPGFQVLGNALTVFGSNLFKSWDAPLEVTGAVTLGNNAAFNIRTSTTFVAAPLELGSVVLPGPAISNPVEFTGGVSGAHNLAIVGPGVAILNNGTLDTYSGGTIVGNGGSPGNLVFAAASSIPSTGFIAVQTNGYVGIADPTSGSFDSLLLKVNSASGGSYGIDTLPGSTMTMYSGPLNLSTLSNSNVEIGTATSAEISGAITPYGTTNFRFGGGGGTLYVDSSLGNAATGVLVTNPGNTLPLTVYFQGYDYYAGTTTASDGFIIFNSYNSIPSIATGKLVAAGSSSDVGGSYIGYTELATSANLGPITAPSDFLGAFDKTNTWGIIGFDSSTMSSVPVTGNIDLTGFNNGVFIGTATAATLSGTITPTSDDIYRFTAAKSGVLTIDSAITWGNGVILGSPNYPQYSSGTVIMDGLGALVNTYSGGTTINGGTSGVTVGLGSSTALGSGTVNIAEGGYVGLEATMPGVTLNNPIVFQDSMSDSSYLYLKGSNSFNLHGQITGDSSAAILMDAPSFSATISGDNSTSFFGSYTVYAGTLNLVLPSNTAMQNATLDFQGPGTISISGATAPILRHIEGSDNDGTLGTLSIASGVTLTFDTTTDNNNDNPVFGGTITGAGGVAVQDSSGGTPGAVVLLFGNNTYTGNTSVTGSGVLVAGNNNALGTGTVTVNTNGFGALALDTGVTLTNPMTYTAGNLVGDGTFNPSNFSTIPIPIGTGDAVAGGLPFNNNGIVAGTLTFGANLAFNNGGEYYWILQDNGRSDGVSHIDVTGNLVVNATAGGFTIKVASYNSSGIAGGLASNFSIYSPMSWAIVTTTTGSIMNFSAADFTIDSSAFEGGGIPSSNFSLTQSGNQLMLNFTPVPEPSTWALLAIGVTGVSLAGLRRRRLARAA
jgi:hypothetical protein